MRNFLLYRRLRTILPASELEKNLLRRVAQVGEQPLHLIQPELIGGSADADGGTHTAIQAKAHVRGR